MNLPNLIDHTSSSHLRNVLQSCHENRVNLYYYIFNGLVLAFFTIIAIATLYYCYTKKPSEYDRRQKLLRDQDYILSKIRFYQDNFKQKQSEFSNITNLPIIQS